MNVHLHQGCVADGLEAVDFAGFDHKDIARSTFKGFSVNRPSSAAFPHKLDFIIGMPMRSRTLAGERAQQATDPSLKSTFAELAKGYVRLELAEQKQT